MGGKIPTELEPWPCPLLFLCLLWAGIDQAPAPHPGQLWADDAFGGVGEGRVAGREFHTLHLVWCEAARCSLVALSTKCAEFRGGRLIGPQSQQEGDGMS